MYRRLAKLLSVLLGGTLLPYWIGLQIPDDELQRLTASEDSFLFEIWFFGLLSLGFMGLFLLFSSVILSLAISYVVEGEARFDYVAKKVIGVFKK